MVCAIFMSVRTDTVNLIVNVNGNNAQNNLNELRKKASDITSEMQGLKRGTQAYIDKAKELKQVTGEMDILKKQIGITALSQKELNAELSKLKALKGSVVPFSAEFKDLDKQIKAVESRLYDVSKGVQGFSSTFSKIGDQVKQFGVLAAAYLGFEFLTSQFQNIISGSAKLSDSLADIRRVAGLTATEVLKLNTELSGLDTRTSTQSLREIAVIAGKLGVAKNDIFDFTAAVDQLVVSLGDELGNADQITTQLGKILNVFDGEVNGDNISRLGNSFVELANAGVASGSFIADFTQRVAGISKASGISLGATVGLGAGLEELGQRSESSSTAIQSLLSRIGTDIPKAAKLAGAKSKEEIQKFANDFATKPAEVLIQFAEALVKNKSSFSEVAASFKDAGEEGARVVGVLQAIGQKGDFMREKIDLGNQALTNTNAISQAFALKNETFGASLDKLGKEFNKLVSSSAVNNFLQGAVQGALRFIEVLRGIPKFLDDNSLALKFLIAGIALLNLSYIRSAAVIVVDTLAKIQNAIVTRSVAFAAIAAEVATAAYITIVTLLAGRITIATAAQRLWAIALSVGLGPLGIIVSLVGAAVVAFSAFAGAASEVTNALSIQAETAREAAKETGKQKAEIEGLTAVINDNTISLGTRQATLQKLISISPEYLNRLTLENIATQEGKTILDNYNKALEASANIKAASAIKERQAAKDTELRTAKQELEIFSKTNDYNSLGDKAKEVLQNSSSADYKNVAIANIQKEIDEQAKNVKAATDNFVEQTKNQESARKNFLLTELTATTQALNATQKGTDAYIKALDKRKQASDKYYAEFGQPAAKAAVADVLVTDGKVDSKKADADQKKRQDDYQKIKEEFIKFQLELAEIKRKADQEGYDPQQKEILAIQQKYDELLKRSQDYYNKLNAIDKAANKDKLTAEQQLIEDAYQKEVAASAKKFIALKQTEEQGRNDRNYKSAQNSQKDIEDQNRQNLKQLYAAGTIDKKEYEAGLVRLAKAARENEIITAENWAKRSKQAAKDVADFKNLQEKENVDFAISERERLANEEKLDAENKLTDKANRLQGFKDAVDEVASYAQAASNILSALNQAQTNRENAQFAREKQRTEANKKTFKEQLDKQLISKEVYNKKVAEADAELDKKDKVLKRKQAERERALNIFQAIINTASAVVEALPNIPLSIAAGVLGLVQIQAISSSPLPELGKGDWVRNGDKHSDASGGINAKIERDEAVISAAAMTSAERLTISGTTAQITSALNSRKGGAKWAGGATILPMWATSMPARINPGLPKIMEQGGIVRPINTPADGAAISNNLLAQLVKEQQLNTQEIKTMKTKLHAVVSLSQIKDADELLSAAKKASGF